jgi:hypothetical protein
LVISPNFSYFPHVSTIPMSMLKVTSPYTCVNGKKNRLFLGLGVYIGVLTYGKFLQTLFLSWVRDVGHDCNYGYFVPFIYILVTYLVWRACPLSMYVYLGYF